ncbi:MAG: S9 family peptidase [Gammaproteobacteria bacterium]|nr:S9 family peptidase [Gammaproteobacteria bacterium]
MRVLTAVAALMLSTAVQATVPAPAGPPPTRRDDVVTRYHNVRVADPYRWLEDADSTAVKGWIRAQNNYTESVLGGFPEGKPMAARVQALALTSTRRFAPILVHGTLFYLRQTPPQPQPVLVAQTWPQGSARVLVDPNERSGVAITGFWPSPDGLYVAYGTAEGGSEATTLHVVTTADGKVLLDALPDAGGGTTPQAAAWDADGKGLVYVRLPAHSPFDAALYHHRLGAPAVQDRAVFGRGLSPVAEYTLLNSADGKQTAVFVHFGDGDADRVYLRTAGGFRRVLGTAADVRVASSVADGAAWVGDRLLVISYRNAPRGKLLSIGTTGRTATLVSQGAWAMHAVAPIAGGFLVTKVWGPDWRVDQYDHAGRFVRTLPLPEHGIGVGDIAASPASPRALVTYSGWNLPDRWVVYDASDGTVQTVFEVRPAADYSKIRSDRLYATSKDGTRVPVTVLAMDDVRPGRVHPTILYGYGGYGICVAPRFLGSNLAWLERGGVYAVANIRGGGEFGEGWHAAGMLGHKQNVFDDFYAAAQTLVARGWTDSAHLGILGGSNGGLLMGAELTQHPRAFGAVVSFVGIYDMLRAQLWPNGRYNISEYGTVNDRRGFDWLYAYSPLHHVVPGSAYPPTLLETGVNDPRVAPWQSRKFAAALQAADRGGGPILLLTRMNEGHGVTASFAQRVGNRAAALTFFAHALDLHGLASH